VVTRGCVHKRVVVTRGCVHKRVVVTRGCVHKRVCSQEGVVTRGCVHKRVWSQEGVFQLEGVVKRACDCEGLGERVLIGENEHVPKITTTCPTTHLVLPEESSAKIWENYITFSFSLWWSARDRHMMVT